MKSLLAVSAAVLLNTTAFAASSDELWRALSNGFLKNNGKDYGPIVQSSDGQIWMHSKDGIRNICFRTPTPWYDGKCKAYLVHCVNWGTAEVKTTNFDGDCQQKEVK